MLLPLESYEALYYFSPCVSHACLFVQHSHARICKLAPTTKHGNVSNSLGVLSKARVFEFVLFDTRLALEEKLCYS